MGPELIAAGSALAALAVHPFVTYPASLAAAGRIGAARPVRAAAPEKPPRVALCVSAYNEVPIIRAKIENLLAMRLAVPTLELLVYVDAATDGTAEILQEYKDQVRVIFGATRQGKTCGMNTLVAATDAEFLVFSDANVRFAADAVPRLLAPFADPAVGCVCGHLIYTAADDSATAATGSAYWRLEERIKDLESRTGSTMGADGSIFAIRRSLHHPPPVDIIDDMFVSLSVLCDGYRVVRAADALAFEATVSRPAEEFRRKTRIACQAFNVHRTLRPRLRRLSVWNRYKYVSHKLLRWFSGYLLVASALLSAAGLAALGAWATLGLAVLMAAGLVGTGLARPSSIAGKLVDMAAAFVATSIGVLRSVRGDRFQTWTPPASARPAE
ncbi:MAG TPA: glycosyltransferase [Acetobacteraceae bacterium]|nr:glycosyltransferase [Acetobacteraceae bacterium]